MTFITLVVHVKCALNQIAIKLYLQIIVTLRYALSTPHAGKVSSPQSSTANHVCIVCMPGGNLVFVNHSQLLATLTCIHIYTPVQSRKKC